MSAFQDHPRTAVVIGAGASGIAAATRLLEHGLEVTVLEAEDRIGGRIHTVEFGDGIVELGAQWIHGEDGNLVYDMVKDLDLVEKSNDSARLYSSDGRDVEELGKDLLKVFEELYEYVDEQERGVSIGEYFNKTYVEKIKEIYQSDTNNLEFALAAMDVLENYVKVYEGSCSWFQASASCDYYECESAQNLSWKQQGFKSVIDLMLKPHPNLNVELNKEVTKITWNLRPSVSCLDGSIYEADHVIFSPSLGVLKSRHSILFEPGLPEEKIRAIEDAGFGKVVKVLLQFEEPWWPPGDAFEGFSCVWLDNDKEKLLQEFPHGPNKNGRSWLLDLACTMKVAGNPNVLMLWFAGSAVCEIEEMPEETFLDGIVYLFEKFLGDKFEVPRPKGLLRTTWNTNPHYKGTYSFQTTESRKNDLQENAVLAEPLFIEEVPRVLFCGEATHSSYFSTVHGAIESGRREAQRIIMHGVE